MASFAFFQGVLGDRTVSDILVNSDHFARGQFADIILGPQRYSCVLIKRQVKRFRLSTLTDTMQDIHNAASACFVLPAMNKPMPGQIMPNRPVANGPLIQPGERLSLGPSYRPTRSTAFVQAAKPEMTAITAASSKTAPAGFSPPDQREDFSHTSEITIVIITLKRAKPAQNLLLRPRRVARIKSGPARYEKIRGVPGCLSPAFGREFP